MFTSRSSSHVPVYAGALFAALPPLPVCIDVLAGLLAGRRSAALRAAGFEGVGARQALQVLFIESERLGRGQARRHSLLQTKPHRQIYCWKLRSHLLWSSFLIDVVNGKVRSFVRDHPVFNEQEQWENYRGFAVSIQTKRKSRFWMTTSCLEKLQMSFKTNSNAPEKSLHLSYFPDISQDRTQAGLAPQEVGQATVELRDHFWGLATLQTLRRSLTTSLSP